jgi:hypothetical protein
MIFDVVMMVCRFDNINTYVSKKNCSFKKVVVFGAPNKLL